MIKDLMPGQTITNMKAMIQDSRIMVAQNKSEYLLLTLGDKTATIKTILWNVKPEAARRLVNGVIVEVTGLVEVFKDRKQIKLNYITPTKDQNIEDYTQGPNLSTSTMYDTLIERFSKIDNQTIKTIVDRVLSKVSNEFKVWPAAKSNHHNYPSGLLDHTTSMIHTADMICNSYPFLNRDLLVGGIILHDIGKVIELSGPIQTSYTVKGNLLGHISIISNEIAIAAKECDLDNTEEVDLLQHMVLSHHGKKEWGSPVTPILAEAEVLHHIDNLDAKLNTMERELSKIEPGTFTEKIFSLDSRQFYKPIGQSNETETKF